MRNQMSMKPFIVLLIVIVTSCASKQEGKSVVSKSTNIPKDAFFVKGKNNDGYWCQADVHDHKNNAFLKIYDGVTGALLQSKRFSVICKLEGNPLWINDLKTQIDYFDGAEFHLKRLPGQDSCWLQ